MIITISNILLGRTPTAFTGEDITGDLSAVTDPDFSTNYTSTDQFRLTLDFGVTSEINYVAYAGLKLKGNEDFTSRVRIRDGSEIIATNFIERNHCVLVTFEPRTFSNLRVGMFNAAGNGNPFISFIAAGVAITAPNFGETSGHNRQFLNRSIKKKTTLNNSAAPIASLQKKISAKGSLNLPNMTKEFSEGVWQNFLDFAVDNHFFMREQGEVENPVLTSFDQSAYLCYELQQNTVKAHSQTRALNNLAVSFKVFNGL